LAIPDSTNTGKARIGTISIIGNKKTKPAIILREIPFHTGEEYSLAELVKKFEIARKQLLNTSLFTRVTVAAKNITAEAIDIEVEVRERNYLFPLPYFRPVDRNLNQWLFEKLWC
jgi:outer membrane protein assembly factor BamA